MRRKGDICKEVGKSLTVFHILTEDADDSGLAYTIAVFIGHNGTLSSVHSEYFINTNKIGWDATREWLTPESQALREVLLFAKDLVDEKAHRFHIVCRCAFCRELNVKIDTALSDTAAAAAKHDAEVRRKVLLELVTDTYSLSQVEICIANAWSTQNGQTAVDIIQHWLRAEAEKEGK